MQHMKFAKHDSGSTWKISKSIKLGTIKCVEKIRQSYKDNGHRIHACANDILGKHHFKVSETEKNVQIEGKSVEELGFSASASYADICKRASEIGLDKCPAEVGPQLPLQCKDQPKKTFVVVAMEAIIDSFGRPNLFYLKHNDDGEMCLKAINGRDEIVWHAHTRFLFMRRKNTQSTDVLQVS
ncbi:MAG: hypothetical protein WCC74_00235 [Minisyncoccia bacterium]